MTTATSICLLEDFGVLRFDGIDARRFLQGQLSNDVQQVSGQRLLYAGLHNAQGRTLALLALLLTPAQEILALLPRELLASVSTLLKRYVLRAKVSISDASCACRIYGLTTADGALGALGQLCHYGVSTERQLLIQDSAGPSLTAALTREQWRALDIAAGLPQVAAVNSAQFVAQMLNLDCIDAISFHKGCYTGQEIIARAHFRGRVKRRMQRFITAGPRTLQPAAVGRLADGRHYRVVDASTHPDGRCEFLAVAHLPGAGHDGEELANEGEPLAATALPLPYELPL